MFRAYPNFSNFSKPFYVTGNASDVGAGAVLLQSDDEDIEHPICYFKKIMYIKSSSQQIEKNAWPSFSIKNAWPSKAFISIHLHQNQLL